MRWGRALPGRVPGRHAAAAPPPRGRSAPAWLRCLPVGAGVDAADARPAERPAAARGLGQLRGRAAHAPGGDRGLRRAGAALPIPAAGAAPAVDALSARSLAF